MENIVLTTLEEKLRELNIQRQRNYEAVENQFNKDAKEIFIGISPIFYGWNPKVGDYDIQLNHPDISSFSGAITIKFPQKQEGGKYVYTEPQLCWKGTDVDKDIELDLGTLIGIMCNEKRTNSMNWDNLVTLFHLKRDAVKAVTPSYREISSLEDEIRKIKANEYTKNIEAKLAKGEIKLNKKENLHYGSGKYDRVFSDHFTWEINKSGKTATLYTIDKEQKHDGEKWVTTDKDIKSKVTERLKISDLRSFISNK
jgi:hypothetical protein